MTAASKEGVLRAIRLVQRGVGVAVMAVGLATAASAQEPAQPATSPGFADLPVTLLADMNPGLQVRQRPPRQQLFPIADDKPGRPGALLPLYGSLIALQGLDIHSTHSALEAGDREANPAMRPVVKNGAAFLAVKAGAPASVIWVSEKMWKKNRKAAVILTAVVNAAMAAVVANNYRVSR